MKICKIFLKKIKKAIDKCFSRMYNVCRKGKGVFEVVPLEDALLVYEVLLTENQIIKAKASLMCKKALEASLFMERR